jgi:hypothetical protein
MYREGTRQVCAKGVILPNGSKSGLFIPLYAFRIKEPLDGWPNLCDWSTVFMDMVNSGEDFAREPVDIKFDRCLAGQRAPWSSVEIGKGTSRVTVPMFILMKAMQLEPQNAALASILPVLRRANGIPANFTQRASDEGHAFDKLYIGIRSTTIRQRPSPLRQAKMMQNLARTRINANPDAFKDVLFSTVVDSVIETYQKHKGVKNNASMSLDEDEATAIRNSALYVDELVMTLACNHLHKYKFGDSGPCRLDH